MKKYVIKVGKQVVDHNDSLKSKEALKEDRNVIARRMMGHSLYDQTQTEDVKRKITQAVKSSHLPYISAEDI